MCTIDWHLIFEGFTAFGTVLVAFIAVYGDYIKQKIFSPRLKITYITYKGEPGKSDSNTKAIYFKGIVQNSKKRTSAKNCKVELSEIHRKLANQEWERCELYGNFNFKWSPANSNQNIDLIDRYTFDFLVIGENANSVVPILDNYTSSFPGKIHKNETLRYYLRVKAEGYISAYKQEVEVFWDGEWTEDLELMKKKLIIRMK